MQPLALAICVTASAATAGTAAHPPAEAVAPGCSQVLWFEPSLIPYQQMWADDRYW